ncbi:hypothetical protein DL1_17975 [Thioclava dalianensis]|uniref:Uncharacterized protein n=1 Tax=Thioclava dalianensis TaxID=1185766 RepID=A0A074TFN4_9RHOB|nr:hypothetical protein [Thioclava dalianensis]KEP70484.1 hypothetical protein DL1_17975 [Thioclava dalianensis]SFN31127.1 hypothetical protein SAMN05216224_10453 [Thioclava dalianensis]
MTAWAIFRHAFRQVTHNLPAVARVSLVPWALGVLLLFAGILGAGMMSASGTGFRMGAGGVFLVIVGYIFFAALFTSIAVNWHRFVLLNEPVTWWPRFHGGRILRYFGRSLLIGIGLGLVFGIALGIAIALSHDGTSGGLVTATVMMIVASVVLGPVAWRCFASLPGAAVDGYSLWKVLDMTRGTWGTMFLLTLIYIGFSILIWLIGMILAALGAKVFLFLIVKILWDLAVGWFTMMLVLSILTTIYGHYVEGRELV